MKPRHDILNNLRRLRVEKGGLTQQQLADEVGVTRQTILSIEKGKYSPTVGLALRLARTLGVVVEDIFSLARGESHD